MYIDVSFDNNAFTINQVENKPQKHHLALETLEKFKAILESEMAPLEGSEHESLSSNQLHLKIHDLTNDIAKKHEAKRVGNECFLVTWVRHVIYAIGLRHVLASFCPAERVENLRQYICSYIPPTKEFLPHVAPDVKREVLKHLPISALKDIALVCKDARLFANLALIDKAKSFGENNAFRSKEYLSNLFTAVQAYWLNNPESYYSYYSRSHIPPHLVSLNSEQRLDREATLENLKSCSTEDIIQIFSNRLYEENWIDSFISGNHWGVHNIQEKKMAEFLLHYTTTKQITVAATTPEDARARDLILCRAALQGNKDLVSLMLAHGATVDCQIQNGGYSPFALACMKGNTEIAKLLLEHGANPDLTPHDGRHPLHLAAVGGHTELMQELINFGINVDVLSVNQQTVLSNIGCSASGLASVARLLLENGADPNLANAIGDAPLHYAASYTDIIKVALLLDHGANIDQPGANGKTALMYAACTNRTDIAKLLLQRGADPNIASNSGNSALHYAAEHGSLDCVRTLLPHANNIDLLRADGLSALMVAVTQRKIDVVALLLQSGADPHIHLNNGDTAFHLAARYGYIDVVRALLPYINDVDHLGQNNMTASEIAKMAGHEDIVQLLEVTPYFKIKTHVPEVLQRAQDGADGAGIEAF